MTERVMTEINVAPEKESFIGSDCAHCSLEEGISCMIYFCKKQNSAEQGRKVCKDGFSKKCPDYKKPN